MSTPPPLQENEVVQLRRREGDTVLLRLRRGPQSVEGRGVVDLTGEIGQPPGRLVQWAGARYEVVRPSLP
ncbi:MAG TPA: hypothetical protein VFG07_05335, partial [Thermoplasmata archaeon]|nr:hypothetical protein [Thermoplasmata archaeon]